MFEKEEELKRCRSLTCWGLLLVMVLGLCILGASFRAAAQSSEHCPAYVEKLDNIHSLADRALNERCRAFAEKLAEMYTLADQSCQAHIKGNAYFEEGSPRADFEYQRALNLDQQILEKIGAIVPTFGVTAELKVKLQEAQRLYSQQVNFYAQSNQLSAQAGMAYRIGNRTVGDRLLDRANSANDSANQLEDRAFALLEEAAELLCQLTEQEEEESVPQPGEATTAIALTPPEGEYAAEGPIEECPECPREQGGPAETTNQGIQVPAPIFGVSGMLFDQVTDCETGEEIDPSLLQTEFVFRSGAQAPYDLSELEKVIVKAEGYTPREMTNFSPMQVSLGFLQVSLLIPAEQSICLSPAASEKPVYAVKPVCQIKHEWLAGTSIAIEEPVDYFPKQSIMPLGDLIAFHIKASDEDVLKQSCYGCDGEAIKRVGPLPDVMTYTWSFKGDRAGKIVSGYFGEAILYALPESMSDGQAFVDILSCTVDDQSWPDHKADDTPITFTAQIAIARVSDHTCRVKVDLIPQPLTSYKVDVVEEVAEDCNPLQEVWKKGFAINSTPIYAENMCAGQLYRLHAFLSRPGDLDELVLKCSSRECGSAEKTVECEDPLTLVWDDNGAGGTFPFGNEGVYVIYQAPSHGKDVKFTLSTDDSGKQADDDKIKEENSALAIEIVRVVADDPRTHEIPSVLPSSASPKQHFVTVKYSAPGHDKMRLRAEIKPDTAYARRWITWKGADADPSNPLIGLIPRTGPLKRLVEIQVNERPCRTCKDLMAWVIWCTLKGDLSTISPSSTGCVVDSSDSNYNKLVVGLDQNRGISTSGGNRTGVLWTATVYPIEIIQDRDHPKLEGKNDTDPPGTTNWDGIPLKNGVDSSKWDMSRQNRTKVLKDGTVMGTSELKAYFRYNVANRDSIFSYPSDDRIGNDDVYTNDETNTPYTSSPLGQLTSTDAPQRSLHNIQGSSGDEITFKLQFREFVRVELDGTWYRCSDWGEWRFHIACEKGRIGQCLWTQRIPPGHVHELDNRDW